MNFIQSEIEATLVNMLIPVKQNLLDIVNPTSNFDEIDTKGAPLFLIQLERPFVQSVLKINIKDIDQVEDNNCYLLVLMNR